MCSISLLFGSSKPDGIPLGRDYRYHVDISQCLLTYFMYNSQRWVFSWGGDGDAYLHTWRNIFPDKMEPLLSKRVSIYRTISSRLAFNGLGVEEISSEVIYQAFNGRSQ
ncbi:MAG: hypothetical protein ACP5U1_10090 [Desulfomonilaceae bacterium]